MGAGISRAHETETAHDRKVDHLLQTLPPEVAAIKIKRLEQRANDARVNHESAMYRVQESMLEEVDNPLSHLLGIGKKPKPKPKEGGYTSAEMWLLKKEQGFDIDPDDPEKKKARRTEGCEDLSKHIVRMSLTFASGFEMVQVTKSPFSSKSHTVESLELSETECYDVDVLFDQRLPRWCFFCKASTAWPGAPDYLDPYEFEQIILRFKATADDFRMAGKFASGLEQKIIDRHRFLKLLLALDCTLVPEDRIESNWNPNEDDPITTEEEPLLMQFEALQVINYYKELDGEEDTNKSRRQNLKVGRISMQDAFRIIMCALIEEATGFDPLVDPYANARASRRRKEAAAERVAKKSVGRLGRMRGPKKDMRLVVLDVAFYFQTNFKPVLDEVVFFEFADLDGERVMRRNTAWEFATAMGSIDLVRMMKLVNSFETTRQNPSGAGQETSAVLKREEGQRYNLARWLRAKILHQVKVQVLSQKFKPKSALELATAKKKGEELLLDAKARAAAAKEAHGWTRNVAAVQYPALAERQRREVEDGMSDLERATSKSKAWRLHEMLEEMDDDEYDKAILSQAEKGTRNSRGERIPDRAPNRKAEGAAWRHT